MNISDYTESVLNPDCRFRTIENIFAVTDNGEPRMTSDRGTLSFDVIVDNAWHVLRCFQGDDPFRDERLHELSAYTQCIDSQHITPQIFLMREMLVFSDGDQPVYVDVVLQRMPDGERLDRLVSPPDGFIDGLLHLKRWLSDADFSHGNICPHNIYLMPNGTPVLVDYTRGSRQRQSTDIEAVDALIEKYKVNSSCAPRKPLVRYDFIGEMREGMMRAKVGDEWVFLNKSGHEIFGKRFLGAGDFIEGRAVVETSTGFGLIDLDGEWVVDPICDDLEWDEVHNLAIVTRDGLSGLCDRCGKPMSEMIYEHILAGNEGYFPVRQGGKYGYLRADGVLTIEPQFDDAYGFRNGVAKVRLATEIYFIDIQGVRVE